jgi:hypothetical protein
MEAGRKREVGLLEDMDTDKWRLGGEVGMVAGGHRYMEAESEEGMVDGGHGYMEAGRRGREGCWRTTYIQAKL